MYCSTMAAVPMLSWMNVTRSFSFSSVSTTDACEMPIDASCVNDFTMSGNVSRLWRRIGRPMRQTSNSGTAMQLLRERLVAGHEKTARIAAGVRQLQQFEVRHDVLVEDRHVVEPFEQVERDVRLPFVGEPADFAKVVVDAEWPHFVPHRGQRRDDVVLGAPRRRRDVGAFVDRRGRNQVTVDQREHAKFGHSATRCRPLCR